MKLNSTIESPWTSDLNSQKIIRHLPFLFLFFAKWRTSWFWWCNIMIRRLKLMRKACVSAISWIIGEIINSRWILMTTTSQRSENLDPLYYQSSNNLEPSPIIYRDAYLFTLQWKKMNWKIRCHVTTLSVFRFRFGF